MKASRIPLLLILLFTLAACSSENNDPSYNGSWTGAIDDGNTGRTNLEFLLVQDDTELRGSWKLTRSVPLLPDVRLSGSLTGTIAEDGEAFELLLTAGACTANASGLRKGRFMTGFYETEAGCIPALEGTFSLRK